LANRQKHWNLGYPKGVADMKKGFRACLALTSLLFISSAWSADWPQFQGPDRNGISPEKGLLKQWPEGGAPVSWSVEVGPGFGGVAIRGGEVYLLDREPGERDILRCFNLDTGEEIWSFPYKAPGKVQYPGSRTHPLVEGNLLFTVGPFGHMHCLDRETHAVLWKTNILEVYGGEVPRWGSSQCPLAYGETIIVTPIGSKAGVVALNKNSGKEIWISKPLVDEGSHGAYGSPMLATIGGVDQVLLSTPTETAGLNAATGEILWRTQDWQCRIPITSPFHVGDGKVFVTGGYRAGAAMFQISQKQGSFECKTLYKTNQCNCQIHQPLLYKKYLYLNGNDKTKMYGMICLDLEGSLQWKTNRHPGFDWGGLLLADGVIYVVDGDTGDLCTMDPSPKKYKELSRMPLLSGKQIWGTVALSEGRLLCRDQTHLKCVDIRK